jgi:putative oxidoreductase
VRSNLLWRSVDFVIGGLFIWAGLMKVADPVEFARDIDNYKILPWSVAVRLAFYLPWLEIFCGLAVVVRRLYYGAVAILTGLIAIFIIAALVAKGRGIDISCGCFGHVSKNFSFTWHIVLDVAIFAALLALYFVSSGTSAREKV